MGMLFDKKQAAFYTCRHSNKNEGFWEYKTIVLMIEKIELLCLQLL